MCQRFEDGVDAAIAVVVVGARGVRAGEVGLAAGEVEDEVAGEFVEVRAGEWVVAVDVVEEVEEGRVVGFHVGGEQAGVDDEDVGALGKGVVAAGGDDGFAELAHGREEEGEFGGG